MKVNQILFIIFMILNAVIPYKIRGLSGDKHVSYKNEQDTRKEKRLEDIHLSRNNQSQQASSVAMDQPNLTPFCHQHDEAVHIELPESNFPTWYEVGDVDFPVPKTQVICSEDYQSCNHDSACQTLYKTYQYELIKRRGASFVSSETHSISVGYSCSCILHTPAVGKRKRNKIFQISHK
ncbi:uncharacterized protein [Montipora capricornis]|uniref:uncharacterized protein n=1 Tax=Montipora capricornis TaxID=246305 RepID=UPI0035F1A7E2